MKATSKPEAKNPKLGIRITVEFTGHLKKSEIDMFAKSLSSVLSVHVENGSNGE